MNYYDGRAPQGALFWVGYSFGGVGVGRPKKF